MLFVELAIVAIAVAFFILLVVVSLTERQYINQLVPIDAAAVAGSSPYFRAVCESARQLGFQPAGVFKPAHSLAARRAYVALFVSPGNEILLRVASGKIAGMPLKRMTLTTYLGGGRIMDTADDAGVPDLSGLTEHEFLINAGLEELWSLHQRRLASHAQVERAFTVQKAQEAYESILLLRAVQYEKLGLGKFIDRDRTVWRHTVKGALRNYREGYLAQLRRAKAQSGRIKLKRPGDA